MPRPGYAIACRETEPLTPVLLASALESDYRLLRDLLGGSRYVLAYASSWHRAVNLLGHIAVPVILYDRGFDAADWRLGVRRMKSSWRSPSVILLSDAHDLALRQDLVVSGGSGLLVRPFDSRQVLEALDDAVARFSRRAVRSAAP